MSDPIHDPRRMDPAAQQTPYRDPALDPRLADRPVEPSSGRGGLIAAGVIAVLLVVALLAFNMGPGTDPATTAVIPEQSEQTAPAPAPEAAPAPAAPEAPAAAPTAPAAPAAPAQDAAPATDAPAANQ